MGGKMGGKVFWVEKTTHKAIFGCSQSSTDPYIVYFARIPVFNIFPPIDRFFGWKNQKNVHNL